MREMNQKIDISKQDVSFQKLVEYIQKTIPDSPGIYSIINIRDKKRYIGRATNLNKRLWGHVIHLQQNRHSNFRLQKAWNQYEGAKSFIIEILDMFKLPPEPCQITFRKITNYLPHTLLERLWIEYYKSYIFQYGYNCNIYQGRKESRNLPC